ncbi:hypothetical protein Tco_1430636 [Tanacetum coccineum]
MESLNSNSQERKPYQLQQMQDKAKERTRIEGGFERAFATLFDQDVQTFTCTMLLNLDQLEKKLDKEGFQKIGSLDAFIVLMTQFQTFINSRFSFDNDDGLMIRKRFIAYTRTDVQQFRVTLIQHMESVKKSIDERAQHKREYDSRVNERQMQSKEGKVDSIKALDASLVVTEYSGTKSDKRDTSSNSGNYIAHAMDVDIRPVNDQVPFAEVDSNTTSDSINMCHRGGEIDQNAENVKLHVLYLFYHLIT